MSGRASRAKPRRVERGGITWVTLLLLVVVVGGSYLGWVWVPLWFESYAVKQVVRDYMNQAIKDPNDVQLRQNMVKKIESLQEVDAVDERGRRVRVPAIDLEEGQITWVRSATSDPPTLHVAFQYGRQVVYPYLDRTDVTVFDIDITAELTHVNWGPSR